MNYNGVLSFRRPFTSSLPVPFPLENYTLIAPFWDQISTSGQVWYRFTSNYSVITRVRDTINEAFDDDFYPQSLLIATWDNVLSNRNLKKRQVQPVVSTLAIDTISHWVLY